MKAQLSSGVAKFAHLLGLPQRAAKAEEDEPDEPKKVDPDDEAKSGKAKGRAEDEPGDEDEDEDEKAESEDEEESAESEDDDEGDDEKKDGKRAGKSGKARKAEQDEDEEEAAAAAVSTIEKSARRAERQRCAAIFRAPAAAKRPDLAAHLAFDTSMSARRAAALLDAAAVGAAPTKRAGLYERMGTVAPATVGRDADAGASMPGGRRLTAEAKQIIAANNRRLGLKS